MPAPALPFDEYPGTNDQVAQEVDGLRLEAGPARLRAGDAFALRFFNATDSPVMALGSGHAFSLHPRDGGPWYRVFAPSISRTLIQERDEQIIVVGDDPAFNVHTSGAVVDPGSASHWGLWELSEEEMPAPGGYLLIATVGDMRPGLPEPTALMATTTVSICAG